MQQPYIIDNQNLILKNDLLEKIKEGSRVSIVAACFSMYAYQQMKRQLSSVKDFRFIYTSPTFTKDTAAKKQREFYIPRMDREHSLYGTEYEIKLRNEMTQKSVAQECAQWISEKATFKSNVSGEMMNGFLVLEGVKGDSIVYSPLNGFTTVDLGCERGNNSYTMMMANPDPQAVKQFLSTFDHLWKDKDKLQDVTERSWKTFPTLTKRTPLSSLHLSTKIGHKTKKIRHKKRIDVQDSSTFLTSFKLVRQTMPSIMQTRSADGRVTFPILLRRQVA